MENDPNICILGEVMWVLLGGRSGAADSLQYDIYIVTDEWSRR